MSRFNPPLEMFFKAAVPTEIGSKPKFPRNGSWIMRNMPNELSDPDQPIRVGGKVPPAEGEGGIPLFSWPWFLARSLLYSSFGLGISLVVGISFLLGSGRWALGGLLLLNYLLIGGGFALRSSLNRRRQLARGRQRREMDEARRARQRAELRLTVLQAQVEPHFLFNTLASVRSLVRQDPGRAEATIDALVGYLRAAIPKLRQDDGGAVSTLAVQFAICESYLKVMEVRMGGRLSYHVDLPPDLAEVSFPGLMLISLVENAIKHGIEPRPGPGKVELRADRPGPGQVRVEVSDDGMGLAMGLGAGVGLANIREHLLTLYGGEASLHLQGDASGGVKAIIQLPERTAA
jgi:sensor histidine kinase YesM